MYPISVGDLSILLLWNELLWFSELCCISHSMPQIFLGYWKVDFIQMKQFAFHLDWKWKQVPSWFKENVLLQIAFYWNSPWRPLKWTWNFSPPSGLFDSERASSTSEVSRLRCGAFSAATGDRQLRAVRFNLLHAMCARLTEFQS
jgi:hypothetical protein